MNPEKKQRIATLLSFALIPLSGFATDIYIPSLPSMGADLGIGSMQVQLTLSLFLISYGLSQLFIGSLLDSFGRYRPGLIALVLFAAASLVIASTQNIYLIYSMRIVHGITVAVIVVAKRAYFVDVFEGAKLKNYLSLFTIIWSVGPIIAPFIGGYLQTAFGWQSNFYFLSGCALTVAIPEFLFGGETLKRPAVFNLRKIGGVYGSMIGTKSFTLGLLMLGFAYSMVMVYNMTGPYIIEHGFGLTPLVAGYSSLFLGFAWMAGGFLGKATINGPFFKKITFNLALQAGFVTAMMLSLGLAANLYTLLFFAFAIQVCAGYTFNNYFTQSLTQFPENAGTASGLTGGVVYIIVSFLSYGIVSALPAKDERNLGFSYLILIALSVGVFLVLFLLKRRQRIRVLNEDN